MSQEQHVLIRTAEKGMFGAVSGDMAALTNHASNQNVTDLGSSLLACISSLLF